MTEWFSEQTLTIAAVLFGAALVITSILFLRPGPKRLPLERRRPGAPVAPGVLTRATTATTAAIGTMLQGRQRGLALHLGIAGITTPVNDLVLMTLGGTLGAFALGLVLRGPLAGLLLGALVVISVWVYVVFRKSRRREAFANALDENLQMMAGSLRAGYSLQQAVAALAQEAEQPTRDELQRVVNETRVGRPINDALEDVARRMDNEDFYWIAQAIAINREVGGNLSDVLSGVARTIRERAQLRRQVSALSAEGKLSAVILMALPLVVLVLLLLINPGYLSAFTTSLIGLAMLAAAVVLLVVGGLWMRVMVKIKY